MTIPETASPPAAAPATLKGTHFWAWAALVVALTALVGSLLLSIALGLKACPLCFYQRTFVMGVVAVLGLGLWLRLWPPAVLSLLALPLAVAGLGVAGFHEYLEGKGTLECPAGLFGWGTAPQQSLAAFAVLVAVLLVDGARGRKVGGFDWPAVAAAVVLGGFLTLGAVQSAPPLPAPPAEPYQQALDGCRPPFRSP
jgi:disulfide bond formation protein DsbB